MRKIDTGIPPLARRRTPHKIMWQILRDMRGDEIRILLLNVNWAHIAMSYQAACFMWQLLQRRFFPFRCHRNKDTSYFCKGNLFTFNTKNRRAKKVATFAIKAWIVLFLGIYKWPFLFKRIVFFSKQQQKN